MANKVILEIPPGLKPWEANNWRKIAQMLESLSGTTSGNTGTSTSATSTNKLKITNGDAVADYLQSKLIAGSGITITKSNTGGRGSEILTASAVSTLDGLSDVDAASPSDDDVIMYDTASGKWVHQALPAAGGSEPALGNPAADHYVLESLTDGTRSWVAQTGSGTSFATNFLCTMSGNQNINTTTWTKVAFDTIGVDANTEWDAVNTMWTCKEDGRYLIYSVGTYVANNSGMRGMSVYLNGAIHAFLFGYSANMGATITSRPQFCGMLDLVVGDDIEIYAYHSSSTSPLSLTAAGSAFSINRIA